MSKMTNIHHSPFSRYFNFLLLLGAWVYPSRSADWKTNLFYAYKVLMTYGAVFSCYVLFLDFYMVIGDFKKITWNLCVSVLFVGELMKNFIVFHYNNVVEGLRIHLHKDLESRTQPEYDSIHRSALKSFRKLERILFFCMTVFILMWLIVWYLTHFWGKREWPLPVRLPVEIDVSDDFTYNVGFVLWGVGALPGISLGAATELAMFSLLIQIKREYEIFLKDIQKINEFYSRGGLVLEVNPYLLHMKTKQKLKEFSIRQQKLFEYVHAFETVFNKPLLIQIFGVSAIILTSAVQCMVESERDPANVSYQLGYIFIIVADLYLVCWFGSKLNDYCRDVGTRAYSLKWYLMNKEEHIYVSMMILRSQNPPRITSGKFIELNVNTFLILMRNLYSWLTLFKELAFKDTE